MLHLSFFLSAPAILIAAVIFFLIIICYLFGYNIRQAGNKRHPERAATDLSAINGTLLGLLGLLLAFTFSMASSRYDFRRQTIVQEANDIGTVILRTDIYPDTVRQLLRTNLQAYVEARISYYEAGMNQQKVDEYAIKTDSISKNIWTLVAGYAKQDNIITKTSEMIPALNDMIDITTTRTAAGEATVPDSIMLFLFILCISSAFLLGYENKNKVDWIVVSGLAIMLSFTVYTIIDLDRPRSGLIKMDKSNKKIIDLRGMFNDK